MRRSAPGCTTPATNGERRRGLKFRVRAAVLRRCAPPGRRRDPRCRGPRAQGLMAREDSNPRSLELLRHAWRNRNNACRDERSIPLLLCEHENILPLLELVCSGGQSSHPYIGWNANGLHPTAVLNGERRCAGLGTHRSIGHARLRSSALGRSHTRYGAIGHSAAPRTLRLIRIHQIASFTDSAQFFREDIDLRRPLRTVWLFERRDTNKRLAVYMGEIGRCRPIYRQGAPEMNVHKTTLCTHRQHISGEACNDTAHRSDSGWPGLRECRNSYNRT